MQVGDVPGRLARHRVGATVARTQGARQSVESGAARVDDVGRRVVAGEEARGIVAVARYCPADAPGQSGMTRQRWMLRPRELQPADGARQGQRGKQGAEQKVGEREFHRLAGYVEGLVYQRHVTGR